MRLADVHGRVRVGRDRVHGGTAGDVHGADGGGVPDLGDADRVSVRTDVSGRRVHHDARWRAHLEGRRERVGRVSGGKWNGYGREQGLRLGLRHGQQGVEHEQGNGEGRSGGRRGYRRRRRGELAGSVVGMHVCPAWRRRVALVSGSRRADRAGHPASPPAPRSLLSGQSRSLDVRGRFSPSLLSVIRPPLDRERTHPLP